VNTGNVLLTVGTVVLAVIVGGLVNWLVRPPWLKTSALATLVVVLLAGLIYLNVLKDGSPATSSPLTSSGSSEPRTSPTTITQVTETPTPTTTTKTTAPRTTSAPPVTAAAANVQYLADMDAVSGTFDTGTSMIGGNKVECGKSLLFSLNTFSSHRSAVFNIRPGLTTFTVVLGLDNGTRDGVKAHFQIYLDGAAINTGYILDVLSVQEVSVSVTGKSRIELTTDGTENGGGTGHVGDATWCDARLTK
jgi:hypothetical protein